MNPDLHERYFQRVTATPSQEPASRDRLSPVKLLFWVFVLVALMLLAFYAGLIAPLLKALKRAEPAAEKEALVLPLETSQEPELPEEDESAGAPVEQEPDWQQRLQRRYGLLNEAEAKGHYVGLTQTQQEQQTSSEN